MSSATETPFALGRVEAVVGITPYRWLAGQVVGVRPRGGPLDRS